MSPIGGLKNFTLIHSIFSTLKILYFTLSLKVINFYLFPLPSIFYYFALLSLI